MGPRGGWYLHSTVDGPPGDTLEFGQEHHRMRRPSDRGFSRIRQCWCRVRLRKTAHSNRSRLCIPGYFSENYFTGKASQR